jgi:hypothetical protein
MLFSLTTNTMAADPNKTIVSDTIYRADGTPAAGTLVISWPAFVTADGKPVAAGSKASKIGAKGAVNIALVPTQGATPAGTYYKVVLNLDEAVSNKDIVDVDKFRSGLGQIIDGTVQCLNASVWAATAK